MRDFCQMKRSGSGRAYNTWRPKCRYQAKLTK